MSEYKRLYIDFDGVICDSVYEAFACSYLAYHRLDDIAAIDAEQREIFYRYRPFIRSGQHLMLLQHCITRGISLSTQGDFEAQLTLTGDEQLTEWRTALYAVRARLIDKQLTDYINLHTLYPHITTHLPALARNPSVHILSTKKSHLISLLLSNADISWPAERLLLSHQQSKIDIIRGERGGGASDERVAFIDDHLPHILAIDEGRKAGIDCYLADWGYVLPEWRDDSRYRHLDSSSVFELVGPFLSPNG